MPCYNNTVVVMAMNMETKWVHGKQVPFNAQLKLGFILLKTY